MSIRTNSFKQLFLFCCLGFHTIILAQDGNYRFENYGNLSILLSGNVTGSVSDLGLTYYNPARLPFVDNNVFTLSAKSYQYNKVVLDETFEEDKKIDDSQFEGIPSMVAGTFKIKQLKNAFFAYSFISKSDRSLKFNYQTDLRNEDVVDVFDGVELFNAKIGMKNVLKEDWFGLTWGQKITEHFSVGLSTFFAIYNFEGSNVLRYSAVDEERENVALLVNDISFEQKSYGMYWKVGAAWEYEKFQFGVNVTMPYVQFVGEGKVYYEDFLSGLGPDRDKFVFNKFEDVDAEKREPFGVSAGAGINIGRSKLHLNVDWFNRVNTYKPLDLPQFENQTGDDFYVPFKQSLKQVFNYGLGAEVFISPKFQAFLSFSSDYSGYNKNANIFDLINNKGKDINYNLDYFHYGLGFDMNLSWAKLVLGTTYSHATSDFERPVEIPSNVVSQGRTVAGLKISRWRFIVGVDIPILEKKLKEVEGGK